jgi:hypothetical protein
MAAKKASKSKKSAKVQGTKKRAKKVAKKKAAKKKVASGMINPFPGGPRWPRGSTRSTE